MKLDRLSREHLDAIGEDYHAHRRFAWKTAGLMLVGAFKLAVHGVYPRLFEHDGSRLITDLCATMKKRTKKSDAADAPEGPS